MEPVLECGWFAISNHWRNGFSHFQKLSIVNSFLARGGASDPLLLLYAGILFGLSLCRSCVCRHSLCEFIRTSTCVWQMLFPWRHLQAVALTIFPSPRKERYNMDIPFRVEHPKVSHSLHWLVVGLCVNHYRLKEASLVKVDQSPDTCI